MTVRLVGMHVYVSSLIMETFRFDYEYDVLAFELVMLTTKPLAILVVNRFDRPDNDFTNFHHEVGRIRKVVLVVEAVLVKSKGLY